MTEKNQRAERRVDCGKPQKNFLQPAELLFTDSIRGFDGFFDAANH